MRMGTLIIEAAPGTEVRVDQERHDSQSMNSKLTGLIAAPYTPFHENYALNLDAIPQQARWLSNNRVSAAFICGTTGEWSSLTAAERMAVAEKWIASAPAGLKVIVHAGHNCLGDAIALASHAARIGACAVAAVAPSFFRPATPAALGDFCREIASAAPGLPFYYYHIPSMTGADFAVIDFLKAAAARIPNLGGVKYTSENLMDYRQCLVFENRRFNILFGRDEMMLAALAMGAEGFVGSTYNFAAPIYHQVAAAFEKGDLDSARAQQTRAIEMIAALWRHGGMSAGKAVMRMLGIDCGPARPPLQNLSPETCAQLRAELQRLEVLPSP
jgi:N-acetylneuraminate lyase